MQLFPSSSLLQLAISITRYCDLLSPQRHLNISSLPILRNSLTNYQLHYAIFSHLLFHTCKILPPLSSETESDGPKQLQSTGNIIQLYRTKFIFHGRDEGYNNTEDSEYNKHS